jgi:hypothetical protein
MLMDIRDGFNLDDSPTVGIEVDISIPSLTGILEALSGGDISEDYLVNTISWLVVTASGLYEASLEILLPGQTLEGARSTRMGLRQMRQAADTPGGVELNKGNFSAFPDPIKGG